MIPALHFRFNVKSFKPKFKSYNVGEKLASSTFNVKDGDEKYEWRLDLYPKGVSDEYKNNLSIHCVLVTCNRSFIRAEWECYIKSESFNYKKLTCLETINQGMSFCWDKFIRTNEVIKKIKEKDFELCTCIRIWYSEKCVIKEIPISKGTNVIIKVGDKISVIDENVLAARSSVFCSMLMHDFREKRENKIEIVGFDYLDVEQIIQFLCNNTIELHEENVESILRFADMYEVDDLKSICENYYMNKISIENVLAIYGIAEAYNAVKLQEKTVRFTAYHIRDLINTAMYKELEASHSNLLDRIIRLIVKCPKTFGKILSK